MHIYIYIYITCLKIKFDARPFDFATYHAL